MSCWLLFKSNFTWKRTTGLILAFGFYGFAWGMYYLMSEKGFERHQRYGNTTNPGGFKKRLPDVILDLFYDELDSQPVDVAFGRVSTVLAIAFPALSLLFMVLTSQWRLTGEATSVVGTVILLNGIVQISTTVPSSYGIDRCNLNNLTLLDGRCSDMMWSGHTVHTVLGSLYAFRAIGIYFKLSSIWFHAIKWIVISLLTLMMWAFLILDQGHYTMDVLVAIIISLTLATNDRFSKFVNWCNPLLTKTEPVESSGSSLELGQMTSESGDQLVLGKTFIGNPNGNPNDW